MDGVSSNFAVQPGKGYVLVVIRGDGKTLVLGTDNAVNRLHLIHGASSLEHEVRAFRTDHFARIVAAIASQFALLADDAFGSWFHVDGSAIVAAIEEFNLETGERVSAGPFKVGARAWIKSVGPGVIRRLQHNRAVVALDDPKGDLREVVAPFRLMKPVLRAA